MPFTPNSAALAFAFLEGGALFFLLVLYAFLAREFPRRFLGFWIAGWAALTSVVLSRVVLLEDLGTVPGLLAEELSFLAGVLFLASILDYTGRGRRLYWLWPLGFLVATCLAVLQVFEGASELAGQSIIWINCGLYISAGWLLWRHRGRETGWAQALLAGALLLQGLHGMDRADWPNLDLYLFRFGLRGLFDLAMGIAMAVFILDTKRSRIEELEQRLRGMALIIAAAAESMRVERVLHEVLPPLTESLGATHGIVHLLENQAENWTLLLRASVGFSGRFLAAHFRIPAMEPWIRKMLEGGAPYLARPGDSEEELRRWMESEKLSSLVALRLPGRVCALGVLVIGSQKDRAFERDDLEFLVRVANLLGIAIESVRQFEDVSNAYRQWPTTFDSISDLILAHGPDHHILRVNRALAEHLGKAPEVLKGMQLRDVLRHGKKSWMNCPYCEATADNAEAPDPTFGGSFLITSSDFYDTAGGRLGTIHFLKEFTGRQRTESRYPTLFERIQEGVFISTPDGRFLDFNVAFQSMLGYESREELLNVDIARTLYVIPAERERLKRILREHGKVTDFEFQIRRRDREIRTITESSFANHDDSGAITSYQGFTLDITERKQAEVELRRRNRELMVLNAIGEMLSQSLDLKEVLDRALQKITELFGMELGAIYLIEEESGLLKRIAAAGHRTEYARHFPAVNLSPELLQSVHQTHATVLPGTALPLPEVFRDVQRKEGVQVAPVVVLWSKDRIVGALVVGSRSMREFSPSESNLLAAVGSQLAATIDKSLLHEETRRAYDNLRRTQEQLLQSEKMAAMGQLISGVAHELNNPLTAILGYSQLLRSDEAMGARAVEYVEKLSKQAQRTHRIVQNLLSFARQHKPERRAVQLNQILEETLVLREYDLKLHNIMIHRELDPKLPLTAGDFHQLQQVFLNILNNAVDAVLQGGSERQVWIRTALADGSLQVEFTDSGPGVQDPLRVFDPFYTTKLAGRGTGLGLSICYGIVKEHGGEIAVKNSPPRGATFSISLPLTAVTSVPSVEELRSEHDSAAGKILLVDGEEAALEIEQDILRGRGLRVLLVRTARAAVEILEREPIDGIVLDVHLPGEISGWGLYRWVESHRPELASHVVFTFSNGREEEVRVLVGNCGCPALQKPFGVSDFWEAIRRVLTREVPAPVKS